MKSDFIDFLELFHLKRSCIEVKKAEGSDTDIEIRIRGPWLHTIMFEIPVLAIVNECYYRKFYPNQDLAEGRRRLKAKMESIKDIQDIGISGIRHPQTLLESLAGRGYQDHAGHHGQAVHRHEQRLLRNAARTHAAWEPWHMNTSRHVRLWARDFGDSQKYAFEMWAKEYRGDLGIALSDVYGMKPFLLDFDMYFCKLFDGARHDSGDPFEWGEHLIEHYRKNRCDPKTKTLIFSDMLDFPKVISLYNAFHGRIRLGFGIGTNLVNDLGIPCAARMSLS